VTQTIFYKDTSCATKQMEIIIEYFWTS